MIPSTFHRTIEKLEASLKGKYLVTVNAADTGGLSRSTVLEVSDWHHLAFVCEPQRNDRDTCC